MKKIISLKYLKFYLLDFISNKTLVLVTGCFDILHQAHKAFLKAAKKQGDLLIVGLEPDKRVTELKGKGRPVNSWQKRAKNLAKLSWVDFIFPLPKNFSQSKYHLELLQLIKPRILAVSQNTPYLEKKRKLIKKVGGKLFVFPFNPQYSTTKLFLSKHLSDTLGRHEQW